MGKILKMYYPYFFTKITLALLGVLDFCNNDVKKSLTLPRSRLGRRETITLRVVFDTAGFLSGKKIRGLKEHPVLS